MKKVFFVVVLMIPFLLLSQSLSKEVISSSGGYFSNNVYSLNLSYGEAVITNMTSTNGALSLSNGFHFVSNNSSLSSSLELLELSLSIYPNPTLNHINILSSSVIEIKFEIYDINGKLISQDLITSDQQINMTQLSSGVYLLKILNVNNTSSKVFRVIKK